MAGSSGDTPMSLVKSALLRIFARRLTRVNDKRQPPRPVDFAKGIHGRTRMSDLIPSAPAPGGTFLLYRTEDGRTRIQCRFEDETIWLTQALIAELFQVSVPTVNEHLKGIFAEGELEAGATIRKFRMVRLEGRREVTR